MSLELFLLIGAAFYFVSGDVTVTLPNGKVRGLEKLSTRNHTFYAFLQVPYAKPPLGKLRFRDPQPLENWIGVLNATEEKSICYQVPYDDEMESEDCLHVNVYTPVHPCTNSSLAVMFYIHGGGFINGESLYTTVGPHHFMDNTVVIVTVSYRLGPFGFLSTRDSVIPGNYGLKDQNMALRWVQKNIRCFGGDPTKVTIFGQSSGAVAVGYQIISKQSQGLFRGAIQQSGSSLTPHGYQRRAKDSAYALAAFIDPNFNSTKSSVELLNFLQNASAADIDAATKKFTQEPVNMIQTLKTLHEGFRFAPVIESYSDDAFITENMYESLARGNINKVPLIVGMTSEEVVSLAEDLVALKKTAQQFDDDLTLLVAADMHIVDQKVKTLAGAAIRRIYTNGLLQDNLAGAIRYFSDALVSRPVMRNAELQSKYTDVYFYLFSYDGQLGMNDAYIEGAENVTHSEDTSYLWVSDDSFDIDTVKVKDLKTSERLLKLYTDFSKTLNPIPESSELLDNVKWSKVTPEKFKYLDIGDDLTIKTNPRTPAYEKWISIYETWGIKPFDTY